ncbi:MAG: acyl-CoA dehydrogenase [Thermoplasmata archaeon]|nr:acyl-CoA dehydrogenase [Thermoplasmata archaeon]
MDFTLSKEQRLVQRTVRDFAEREVGPLAQEIDQSGRFPVETVEKMGKLGLLGMMVDPRWGGGGLDTISYSIAIEELSRACATTGVICSVNNSLCCWPIEAFGTDDQKERYLRRLATTGLGAFGLTEPGAGTDAGSQRSVAVREGEGYVINGSKVFISNAEKADIFIIFVLTDPKQGSRGISAFIVERGMPGFSVGKIEDKMGIRGNGAGELFFDDLRVPRANLLGGEGKGFKIAMSTLDGGRIGIAAQAVGIAQAALDESLRYSIEREQFGKSISKFQAIQWFLADMATEIAASRHLVRRAAYAKDRGRSYSVEAAMAKLMASDVAVRVTRNAIQVHGGYGYIKDYTVERLYRDAKITELYEGTSEVQRMVIAGSLLR